MKRIGLVIASVAFVFASAANAQSVSGRVTGTVGEAGAGAGLSGSQAPSSSNPSNSSLLGGELPAGVKMKLGDKVINLPGNVGVGDNGGNFKAGVGLPF
jgi:opacity protein-like surface antigen